MQAFALTAHRIFSLLVLVLATGSAFGQVIYKVIGPDSRVTYTDQLPTEGRASILNVSPTRGITGRDDSRGAASARRSQPGALSGSQPALGTADRPPLATGPGPSDSPGNSENTAAGAGASSGGGAQGNGGAQTSKSKAMPPPGAASDVPQPAISQAAANDTGSPRPVGPPESASPPVLPQLSVTGNGGSLEAAASAPDPCSVSDCNPDNREVLVTVMSWNPGMGVLNGAKFWQGGGYGYQHAKGSHGVVNYPTPALSLPSLAPPLNSPDFLVLSKQSAMKDLALMRNAGFDVALFDMLPAPDFRPDKPLSGANEPFFQWQAFLEWLSVAPGNGMKVGIFADLKNQSAEYPAGRVLNVSEWAKVIGAGLSSSGSKAGLWRIDGRPAVVHFGTDSTSGVPPSPGAPAPDGGWRDVLAKVRSTGHNLFFMADIRLGNPAVWDWDDIADGEHMFAAGAPDWILANGQTTMSQKFSKPVMWSVSPSYYRSGVAYVPPDFRRIHATYMAAVKANAKYINVMTWNDWAEDTDIVPSSNKGDALLHVFGFYNEYFKTGKVPAPKGDKVIVAYPLRIPASIRTPVLTPQFGGPQGPELYSPRVYFWANLTQPTSLTVDGIGTGTLPAGLSLGVIGVASAGPIRATIGTKTVDLPSILSTSIESQRGGEGGLEYRYVVLE